MLHAHYLIFACTLILTALTATTARADELTMMNGDRLSGTAVRMEEGVLEFATEYGGTVPVAWAKVQELYTQKPMRVLTDEGQIIESCNLLRNGGLFALRDRGEQALEVTRINPEAWVNGEGHLLTGEADISMKLDRGNTTQDAAELDGALEWKHLRHRVKLRGELEYNITDGEKTTDQWDVSGKYDNIVSARHYYGGKVSVKEDRIAGLQMRISTGPYLGRQFLQTPVTSLSAELGMEYISEQFTEKADARYGAGAWSVNFKHALQGTPLQFYHRQKGFTNVNNLRDVVVDSWTGVKAPIKGGFTTSVELKTEYSGEHVPGTDPWDLTYRLKFGYLW